MVHERYVWKNGKRFGPYYYESYRENGKIKKRYLGHNEAHAKKSYSTLVVAVLLLIVALGTVFIASRFTGNAVVEINEVHGLNEKLGGNLSFIIEEGDLIPQESQINLILKRGGEVVAENSFSLGSFMSGLAGSELVETSVEICTNESVESWEESCSDEEVFNEETNSTEIISNCINETLAAYESVCTNSTDYDYYYKTPGEYTKDLSEFIDYTFSESGEYSIIFESDGLNAYSEVLFDVTANESVDNSSNSNESAFENNNLQIENLSFSSEDISFSIQSTPGDISECQVLDTSGIYTLTTSLNPSGTCFSVAADNVEIDCNGFSITGDGTGYGINATNSTGPTWNNVTIRNCTLSGFTIDVAAFGALGSETPGYAGSNLTVYDSTLDTIHAYGGNSSTTFVEATGGNGGVILISRSQTGKIYSYGGNGEAWGSSGYGGSGGDIIIENSTITSIHNSGGHGDYYPGKGGDITATLSVITNITSISGSPAFDGSFGGKIFLDHSNFSSIYSYGGGRSDSGLIGGGGGNLTLIYSSGDYVYIYGISASAGGKGGSLWSNFSTINYILDNHGGGGSGATPLFGESGGQIYALNSTFGTIYSHGGYGAFYSGDGGNVYLTESSFISINLTGGNCGGEDFSSEAGRGGNLQVNSLNVSLNNADISLYGGICRPSAFGDCPYGNGTNGQLLINYTLFSGVGTNYYGQMSLIVSNRSYSALQFLDDVNNTLINALIMNATLSDNYVFINSSSSAELNKSANVTFYGLATDFVNPRILRDGLYECNSTTTPSCYNFTSLNAGTVVFNVSSWSSYSIADSDPTDITACGVALNLPNTVYNLLNDLTASGTCLSVTAENVTLNCAGHSITGDGTGYGINATNSTGPGWNNLTVRNCIISGFAIDVAAFGAYKLHEDSSDTTGYNGGNINIYDSNFTSLKNYGGTVNSPLGLITTGNGGSTFIVRSNISQVHSYGGLGEGSTLGGNGGDISVIDSTVNIINASALEVSEMGGNGGSVRINGSIVGIVSTFGGNGGGNGGNGGNVIIHNSTVGNISSYGGGMTDTFPPSGSFIGGGGSGGDIVAHYSNLTSVYAYGADSESIGGSGGDVELYNSRIALIYSHGGGSTNSLFPTGGGNGGSLLVRGADVNLTNTFVSIPGAICTSCSDGSGVDGLLSINYSSSFIDSGSTYNSTARLKVINSSAGEIAWISNISGNTIGGKLSSNISLSKNFSYVDSAGSSGLNKSANITFYGLATDFVNPRILRDGLYECNSTTIPSCYNFTSLNAGTVIFNVSSWSSYSIEDVDITAPVVTITSPTATTYSSNNYNIDIGINEAGICNYSLDGGITNITLTANSTNTGFTGSVSGASNGNYVLTALCSDSAGNRNDSTNVSFTVNVVAETPPGGGGGGSGSGGSTTPPAEEPLVCTPSYVCGSWSTCTNGVRSRSCNDVLCSTGTKVESESCVIVCESDWSCGSWGACSGGTSRRACTDRNECPGASRPSESMICISPVPQPENPEDPENPQTSEQNRNRGNGNEGCTPNITCGEWGTCSYSSKTEDVIGGKISLSGEKIRTCSDSNICIPSYEEKEECKEYIKLEFRVEEVCGKKTLSAYNAETQVPVTNLDLDKFKASNKLSVVLVQGQQDCGNCTNGIKDGQETGIDCGGSCGGCIEAASSYVYLWDYSYIWLLWFVTIVLLWVLVFLIWKKRRKTK